MRRRQFLRISGVSVVGAVVLGACGDEEPEGAGETGVTTASTSSTTAPPDTGVSEENDIVLVRTGASLENLAVVVYGAMLGDSVLEPPVEITFDPTVLDAARRFRAHHRSHADTLNEVLTDGGEDAYTEPNPYLLENVVQPDLPSLTDQEKWVRYVRELENIAVGSYAYSAGVLSSPELRTTVMSIAGAESRYASALALTIDRNGRSAVPLSLTDAGPEGRVPDDALVTGEEEEEE